MKSAVNHVDFNILHWSLFLFNIRPTLDRDNSKGVFAHSDRKNWVPQRQKAALHQYSSSRITASLATSDSPHYKDLIFNKWKSCTTPTSWGNQTENTLVSSGTDTVRSNHSHHMCHSCVLLFSKTFGTGGGTETSFQHALYIVI